MAASTILTLALVWLAINALVVILCQVAGGGDSPVEATPGRSRRILPRLRGQLHRGTSLAARRGHSHVTR